jgi:3-dehydroquinate synthase
MAAEQPRLETMSSGRIRIAAPSAYDVVVRRGALAELPARIAEAAPAAAYALITPHGLAATHGARAATALREAGLQVELLPFDDGEANKTRTTWAELTDRMLERRLGRDACVIAVGGGVTGDVAGFVAATYMRGLPLVQVPTTLLAMIDASVGGKTGVDTAAGKNLVGAFIAPALVVADPDLLGSLPRAQLAYGLAEALKHGAILDAAYFRWIDEHAHALLACDSDSLGQLILRSIELKADVVADDPFELGRRAILNFGHTIGHALEVLSGFALPHGAAVAAGMCAEASLGETCGITEAGTADALARLVGRLGLPAAVRFDASGMLDALTIDKKARRARPRFALLRRIGECAQDEQGAWTHDIDSDTLRHVLDRRADAADSV